MHPQGKLSAFVQLRQRDGDSETTFDLLSRSSAGGLPRVVHPRLPVLLNDRAQIPQDKEMAGDCFHFIRGLEVSFVADMCSDELVV